MGRKKKVIEVDKARFSNMTKSAKLKLYGDFEQLFHFELERIPYCELVVEEEGKAEDIAQDYFTEQGFEVHRSRVEDGYRSIGAEFYWPKYVAKKSKRDRLLEGKLRSLMSPSEFRDLASMVEKKSGTPDLLLIRNNQISFVEVKFNYETVKTSTLNFFTKFENRWPISILRVIRKK